MNSILILISLVTNNAFAQPSVPSQQVNCQASAVSCDYYKCKEAQKNCGNDGYWIGFGQQYCQKFLENEAGFSAQTQSWFHSVRFCLQNQTNFFSSQNSCSDDFKQAMHAHVNCYAQTGFCQLSIEDRIQIMWYLKDSLTLPETYSEGLQVELRCLRDGELNISTPQ